MMISPLKLTEDLLSEFNNHFLLVVDDAVEFARDRLIKLFGIANCRSGRIVEIPLDTPC
jgi:hypothetical protein